MIMTSSCYVLQENQFSGVLYMKQVLSIRLQKNDFPQIFLNDVIISGAVCDFRLGYGRTLNRRAKIVAINRDKQQLYKNSDMFWKPTIAIQADVGTTIDKIARRLKGNYACPKEWLGSLVQRDEEKEAGNATKAQELTKLHLNPVKVLLEAEEVNAKGKSMQSVVIMHVTLFGLTALNFWCRKSSLLQNE